MPLRYVTSPVIGTGIGRDTFRPAVTENQHTQTATVWNGTSNWMLTLVDSSDFTQIDADSRVEELFSGDVGARALSTTLLFSGLKNRTVGDLTAIRKAAILSRLGRLGISAQGLVNATSLFEIYRRACLLQDPTGNSELFGVPRQRVIALLKK